MTISIIIFVGELKTVGIGCSFGWFLSILPRFLILHPDLCPFHDSACLRKEAPFLSLNEAGQHSVPEKFRRALWKRVTLILGAFSHLIAVVWFFHCGCHRKVLELRAVWQAVSHCTVLVRLDQEKPNY